MAFASPENFICVACEREVDRRWWSARDRRRNLPPICSYCESRYTGRASEPKNGTFMDRRNAVRIAALAECLLGTAGCKEWEQRHGRA
jgi:hypothetical protein